MNNVLILSLFMFASTLLGASLDVNRVYTVAFAQDTLDNDYRLKQVQEVQKALSKYPNIHFVYSDAKSSAAMQIQHIQEYISQDVDLLMTSPYDEVATVDVISKAYKKGIPVVFVERKVEGDMFTSYIHPDNRKIARDAAEYTFKKMNYKGTVLLLKGVPKADATRKRTEAFFEVLNKYPNIKVIQRTANYLRRDAIIEIDRLLSEGKHFDAIMSQSDSMLVGARMALEKNSIDPSSLVTVGIDYIPQARDAIRNAKQTSSFVYSLCSKKSAEIAVEILAGESVKKEIYIKSVQITKDNVNDIPPIF